MTAIVEVSERAPAKINLALHVTGRRADGYHELDSIVTFATVADTITAVPADEDRFEVIGPYRKALVGAPSNLVEVARDRLRAALLSEGKSAPPVAISLDKTLPVAGGIGGGSADAAATLRALSRLWGAQPGRAAFDAVALSIGADVPMCLLGRPARARGIGEWLEPIAPFPSLDIVLVNPGVSVSTPAVFARLERRDNAPPVLPEHWGSTALTTTALATLRNDLEPAATALAPEVGAALKAVRGTAPLVARMSGSGATCFGIYPTAESARQAASAIRQRHRNWFVVDCRTTYGVADPTREPAQTGVSS